MIESTFQSTSFLLPHEEIACQKIIENWKRNVRILVNCQDQQQAEKIDEYLWQLELSTFIPHNLVGEGQKGGSPIEIGWIGKRSNGNRQLLINLQETFPEFSPVYHEIIDFVPNDEHLKTLARERYIAYKNVGFNLKTIKIE